MAPGDDADVDDVADAEAESDEPAYEGAEGEGGLYAGGLPLGDG